MARIVQLTDLHLTAAPTNHAWGSDVWTNLERTLAHLRTELPAFDRLVLSGDLATQRRPETYARLRAAVAEWRDRLRVLPGNHDDRDMLRAEFAERLVPDSATLNFVDRVGEFALIGLDSKWPWHVYGRLGSRQLAWFANQLSATREPVLVFLHHPPMRVGTWWLDKDLLRDRRELLQVVQGSSVRAFFCGHVHQDAHGRFGDADVWATPSTAYQFRPHSWLPGARSKAPAFRIIELEGERIETRVVRL